MLLAQFAVGQVFLSMLWFFLFFMWIMLLFNVFADVFRSTDLSGAMKVLWLIFVIVFPYLGVFVYLIARGGKMAEHKAQMVAAQEEAMRGYIQQAAGGTARTTKRTITEASLDRQGDEIVLRISGDAFLYNMVRIIAGTLIYVGQGRLDRDAFARAIRTGDRLLLGPTAPARGLTLMHVRYEDLP